MRNIKILFLAWSIVVSAASGGAFGQQTAFMNVKAWRSQEKSIMFRRDWRVHLLRQDNADLVIDEARSRLMVKIGKPLNIGFEQVQRLTFEVTAHMRGGWGGALIGGFAGALITSQTIKDYWCLIDYRGDDGSMQQVLLEIDKGSSEKVLASMRRVFCDRLEVPEFPQATLIDRNSLPQLKLKHKCNPDLKSHPLPAPVPGKALVVVLCPALSGPFGGVRQVKLHANDRVVAVNQTGSYSFCHLDPGHYRLVSQSAISASGLELDLEPGKEYYFLQNTIKVEGVTHLSMHSRGLVMYMINGAQHSTWKSKD